MTFYHFSRVSGNDRLGNIPAVTISSNTCPTVCPFKDGGGCYAEYNAIGIGGHWRKVSAGIRGGTIGELAAHISALPEGTMWRYGQAGDLPGEDNALDRENLALIVRANNGRRGFAYTHKPLKSKRDKAAIKKANSAGFTVNLSADNLAEADKKASWKVAPTVVVVPDFDTMPSYTQEGRKLVPCPKQTHKIPCRDCGLCAIPGRKSIIAFAAHGNGRKKVAAIAAQ